MWCKLGIKQNEFYVDIRNKSKNIFMSHYRHLPKEVTIKKSEYLSNITGKDELGMFASDNIGAGTRWMTHVKTEDPIFEDGYIRLPMGGFFNHNSVDPNCQVIHEEKYIFFETLRDIDAGEELTAKYTLYDPEK